MGGRPDAAREARHAARSRAGLRHRCDHARLRHLLAALSAAQLAEVTKDGKRAAFVLARAGARHASSRETYRKVLNETFARFTFSRSTIEFSPSGSSGFVPAHRARLFVLVHGSVRFKSVT